MNITKIIGVLSLMGTLLLAQPAVNEQVLSGSGGDAVSMERDWAVVGDITNNKAHIFKLDYSKMQNTPMDMWVEQQPLLATTTGTDFGASVAIHGDAMLVGAPKAGVWQMTVASADMKQKNNAPYFTTVNFPEPFETVPAVFLLSTSDGGQPAAIRIKNVTKTGFYAAPVEPKNMNGPHNKMIAVHYLAIEKGWHTFTNGNTIIVGDVNTTDFQMNPATGTAWKSISLPASFTTVPVMLGQIQTMENDPDIQPKQRPTAPWITTVINNIQNGSFDIALERSEVNVDSVSKGEIIAWMAIEEASGSLTDIGGNTVDYEIRKVSGIKGWDEVGGKTCTNNITFNTTFTSSPLVIASKISRTEADGGWLRRCNIDSNGVGIEVDEDEYQDTERGNATGEDISLFAFSAAFTARMTPGAGEVYFYRYNTSNSTWELNATIKPDDKSGEIGFGSSVAIQTDGTNAYIAIGAPDGNNNIQ